MRLLLFIVTVLTAFTSYGLNCADSVNVYFRIGHGGFDPALNNNRAVMNGFVEKVKEAAAAGDIERIVVYGYASPEGRPKANERLARNRCVTIADYIADKAGVDPALIEKRPSGVGWNELLRLVEANPDVPHRQQVIDILTNTPVWIFDAQGRVVGSRKKQLMDLAGGRPWNWMFQHLFPELRNSVAISLYSLAQSDTTDTSDNTDTVDTSDASDTESVAAVEVPDSAETVEMPEADLTVDEVIEPISFVTTESDPSDSYKPNHVLALKTNLLYYGALLPNLELEWLVNDHWSVALEGNIAWWGSYRKDKSYRLVVIDAEARRWIKPRSPWHGLYVGFIAGGGWYDLERHYKGKYGEGLMTGISAGYMWPIGRRLSLEAELGAGYIYTRYKTYKPVDGHHVYQATKELNYFGPVKLKFSVVWRFFDVNKPKHADKAL